MSLSVQLIVHEWNNPVFKAGFDTMNFDLMKAPGISELYDEVSGHKNFRGIFQLPQTNTPRQWDNLSNIPSIYDRDMEDYADYPIEIYSCFGVGEMQVIANHLDSGRIVFHITVEGNPDEYWIVEPNRVRKGKLKVI